jgi:hypothetical protein
LVERGPPFASEPGDGRSILVAGLLETGQPVFTLTDEHGTPTA